jgi:hypothetical protein
MIEKYVEDNKKMNELNSWWVDDENYGTQGIGMFGLKGVVLVKE